MRLVVVGWDSSSPREVYVLHQMARLCFVSTTVPVKLSWFMFDLHENLNCNCFSLESPCSQLDACSKLP